MSISEILHKNNQINKTFEYVCNTLDVSEKDVRSKQRYGKLVRARRLFSYLLLSSSSLTLSEIGAAMHRGHYTVIYYRDNIANERKYNKVINEYYDNHLKMYYDFLQQELDSSADDYLVSRKDVGQTFTSIINRLDTLPLSGYVKKKVVELLLKGQHQIVNR